MKNMYMLKKEAEARSARRIARLIIGIFGGAGAGLMSCGFGLMFLLGRKGVLTSAEALPMLIVGIAGGALVLLACAALGTEDDR